MAPVLGGFGYQRFLLAGSPTQSALASRRGTLVYGLELNHTDGPWVNPDDYGKVNGVLRYTRGDERNGFTLTGMGYNGKLELDRPSSRTRDSKRPHFALRRH